MGDLIRHADTSIPGLPSDVAGADVPGELGAIIKDSRMVTSPDESVDLSWSRIDEDLLMQRLCSYVVSVQHVALLEGQKRRK